MDLLVYMVDTHRQIWDLCHPSRSCSGPVCVTRQGAFLTSNCIQIIQNFLCGLKPMKPFVFEANQKMPWLLQQQRDVCPVSNLLNFFYFFSSSEYIGKCQLKKSQPKSWEFCFIWWKFLGLKPGRQDLKDTWENCSKKVREEARWHKSFAKMSR